MYSLSLSAPYLIAGNKTCIVDCTDNINTKADGSLETNIAAVKKLEENTKDNETTSQKQVDEKEKAKPKENEARVVVTSASDSCDDSGEEEGGILSDGSIYFTPSQTLDNLSNVKDQE